MGSPEAEPTGVGSQPVTLNVSTAADSLRTIVAITSAGVGKPFRTQAELLEGRLEQAVGGGFDVSGAQVDGLVTFMDDQPFSFMRATDIRVDVPRLQVVWNRTGLFSPLIQRLISWRRRHGWIAVSYEAIDDDDRKLRYAFREFAERAKAHSRWRASGGRSPHLADAIGIEPLPYEVVAEILRVENSLSQLSAPHAETLVRDIFAARGYLASRMCTGS